MAREDASVRMQQRIGAERTLQVKVEAVLEHVSPADTLMVWREAHLYPKWFPLMTGGTMVRAAMSMSMWP